MLANSPKDNPLPSSNACALYYFPEIPGSQEQDCAAPSTRGHFVSGPLDQGDEITASGAQDRETEPIQQLIDEAFNKGKNQGCAETVAAQQEHVDNGVNALKRALKEIHRIRQQDVDRMETETVRLALAIAKKVIGYETEHGPVIAHVLKKAMKQVVDHRHLILRLNPKDIDSVNGLKPELHMADDSGTVVRLEADESIQRGGCIIETKLGDLDARIDQQIRIIEALLKDQLPRSAVKA